VTVVPTDTINAYERVRAAVLCAVPERAPNLGTLRREGLAAWVKAVSSMPNVGAPFPSAARRTPVSRNPAPASSELTRLIASIVLAITGESAHV